VVFVDSIFKSGLLQGQHAIITGAGSGINKRIAERFASQGASVSIIGRNAEKCEAAAADIRAQGGKAAGFAADVRSFDALTQAFELAKEQFGPADICIAGAAGNFVAEAGKMSANAFRTVIEIDLLGTYNTFRAVLPLLRSGGGNLIAISAVQASMPTAAQSHVCSAKAGVEMLIRTLSIEWAELGIRCNAIAPGPVSSTEGMERLAPDGDSSWERLLGAIPMRRAADRDEIADLALFLCSGASSYINGTSIAIDGGQSNNGSFQFSRMLLDSLKSA
jgi:NAD(P)-dependent dehydrogenase (short-subunit alcohol dehydrogenase family)